MKSIVSMKQVGKRFVDEDIRAVEDLNLEVKKGEFVSVVGPSGCGKTTILQMLADVPDRGPRDGTLLVDGSTPHQARTNQQEKLSLIFQRSVLFLHLSALENVILSLRLRRDTNSLKEFGRLMGKKIGFSFKKEQEYERQAAELLEMVGIDSKYWSYLPGKLSGGMNQRVCIAQGLILDPPILLMDEPFGSIDGITRKELNLDLLRIWRQGNQDRTILFVTHSIKEAVFLSDRVIVMSTGPGKFKDEVLVNFERPRELKLRFQNKFTEKVQQVTESMELINKEQN